MKQSHKYSLFFEAIPTSSLLLWLREQCLWPFSGPGSQPSNVGEFLNRAEPQLALRVCVVGLGEKQEEGRTESYWWGYFKYKL